MSSYRHRYMHTYIQTSIHTCIHTHIHTYILAYVHMYIRSVFVLCTGHHDSLWAACEKSMLIILINKNNIDDND